MAMGKAWARVGNSELESLQRRVRSVIGRGPMPGASLSSRLNTFYLLRRSAEPLAVAFEPLGQFGLCFFELVAVDKSSTQGFEECTRARVVGELVVSLGVGPGRVHREQLFVERREPALHPAKAEAAFSCYRPVRKTKGEIPQGLGLEFGQQRPLEIVLE